MPPWLQPRDKVSDGEIGENAKQRKLGRFKRFWKSDKSKDQTRESNVPFATGSNAAHPSKSETANSTGVVERSPVATNEVESIPDHRIPTTTSLSLDDLRAFFSGAPQFSITTVNDAPQPAVEFPWDFDLQIRELTDCAPFEHATFASATCRPHISTQQRQSGIAEYNVGIFEIPNMISAQGKEPGTVGFEYFLQLPTCNAGTTIDSVAASGSLPSASNSELLQHNPERIGLRKLNPDAIYERLVELCDIYKSFQDSGGKNTILQHQSPAELYTILFAKLLAPPRFDSSATDPTGLKVQIEALLRVLRIDNLWLNLSNVDSRLRLGQIVFTDPPAAASRYFDTASMDRTLLLLQVVIAAELLLRLDAIAALSPEAVEESLHLSAEEVGNFRSLETTKTRWDLVLARRFLSNLQARVHIDSRAQTEHDNRGQSWSFLASSATSVAANPDPSPQHTLILLPRRLGQQLSGLVLFAREIGWPDADEFEAMLIDRFQMGSDLLATPIPSVYVAPFTAAADPKDDGGSSHTESITWPWYSSSTRSLTLRTSQPSVASSQVTSMQADKSATGPSIGGWLSRTFFTALIMPGDAFSDIMMSTLLENDTNAIQFLGPSAKLSGGFTYQSRSWWRKTCILGRVLACLDGATECAGWIQLPLAPSGQSEAWVDISSRQIPKDGEPRIKHPHKFREAADLFDTKDPEELFSTDFILARDIDTVERPSISIDDILLDATDDEDSAASTQVIDASLPAQQPIYHATVTYSSVAIEFGMSKIFEIPLRFDVQFVSAFPCMPPTVEKLRVLINTPHGVDTDSMPGHPLHTAQIYEIVSAIDILSRDIDLPPTESGQERARELRETGEQEPTLILDVCGDPIYESVGRAWCSSKGYHALIARQGVTCLACAVREARALEISIILRVG